MLITRPLRDALAQLEANFGLTASALAREEPVVSRAFRTAAIKSFEYVYDLSVRLLRDALAVEATSSAESDEMDYTTLIRTAAEKGLIDDPLRWYVFRDKRGITALAYDPTKAGDVLVVVPRLIERARFLLTRLRDQDAS